MVRKDGTVVLNNFQQGAAESPHLGFGRMQCVDLDSKGVAKIQKRTKLKYTTVGLPLAIVRDLNGNEFVGTESGYLYKNGVVLDATLGKIYDLLVFKNYLLVFRETVIDTYGPLDNAGVAYFMNWKTGLTSSYHHKAIADPDNDVFVGNAGYVAKITGFTAGAVGVAPTATFTATEKTLPSGHFVRSLAMKGIFLAIGTQGGLGYTDFNQGLGNIYFWDRASSLFEDEFAQFNESGVHQILNIGNSLIVHAGIYGSVYEVNGVNFGEPKKINFNNFNNATTMGYPNAIGKIGREIVLGTSTNSDAYPTASTHGVWALNTGAASLRNIISTDNYGTNQILKVGAILALNSDIYRSILIGWQDGTTYGVDEIDTKMYDEYQTIIEGPLEHVGEYLNKVNFNQLEISLEKPLITGQKLLISYRRYLEDDWYPFGTYDTSNTDQDEMVIFDPTISTLDLTFVQLQVKMLQLTTVSYLYNIGLREVRLKKV